MRSSLFYIHAYKMTESTSCDKVNAALIIFTRPLRDETWRLDTGLWMVASKTWSGEVGTNIDWNVSITDGRFLAVELGGHKRMLGFLGKSSGGQCNFLVCG